MSMRNQEMCKALVYVAGDYDDFIEPKNTPAVPCPLPVLPAAATTPKTSKIPIHSINGSWAEQLLDDLLITTSSLTGPEFEFLLKEFDWSKARDTFFGLNQEISTFNYYDHFPELKNTPAAPCPLRMSPAATTHNTTRIPMNSVDETWADHISSDLIGTSSLQGRPIEDFLQDHHSEWPTLDDANPGDLPNLAAVDTSSALAEEVPNLIGSDAVPCVGPSTSTADAAAKFEAATAEAGELWTSEDSAKLNSTSSMLLPAIPCSTAYEQQQQQQQQQQEQYHCMHHPKAAALQQQQLEEMAAAAAAKEAPTAVSQQCQKEQQENEQKQQGYYAAEAMVEQEQPQLVYNKLDPAWELVPQQYSLCYPCGYAAVAAGAAPSGSHSSEGDSNPTVDSCCCQPGEQQQQQQWDLKNLEDTPDSAAVAAAGSSNYYGDLEFKQYYINIGALDPNSKVSDLDLPASFPGLKFNGRDRGAPAAAAKLGKLHALRKLCRPLRAAMGPQAEEAWRNMGLKHRDSKGAVNLGGCYAFLESVFGLGSCPYSRADKVQAAVWDLSRTAGDMDWLWPQAQELNEQGIVCYLARLVSWGLGRVVAPAELNSCFRKGGNGYKTDDNKLKELGAYLWNWPLPLILCQVQLSEAQPPRVTLPANRAPKGSRAAAGAAGKVKKAGTKRKAADDDSRFHGCDYTPTAAAAAAAAPAAIIAARDTRSRTRSSKAQCTSKR